MRGGVDTLFWSWPGGGVGNTLSWSWWGGYPVLFLAMGEGVTTQYLANRLKQSSLYPPPPEKNLEPETWVPTPPPPSITQKGPGTSDLVPLPPVNRQSESITFPRISYAGDKHYSIVHGNLAKNSFIREEVSRGPHPPSPRKHWTSQVISFFQVAYLRMLNQDAKGPCLLFFSEFAF